MSYVDLHVHLLPGVDDGARDLTEALDHARRMIHEGVREATVTPHVSHQFPLDVNEIPVRTARLQDAIDALGGGLHLRPGGELHPDRAGELSDEELSTVAQGPPGARWVLLEVPFAGVDGRFVELCGELRRRGYGQVIAHPERAAGLLEDGLELLRGPVAAGAVLQVNVDSLLGNQGLAVQDAAAHLLRTGLAYLVASDGHPGSREHTQRLGFDLALRLGASSVQAWRLTQANPRFLLRHGIPATPPRMRAAEAVAS